MQRIRATSPPVCAVWTAIALGAVLAGCASSRLSSAPPPGVRLAGDWKLDSARSDDLGRAVQELRRQAEEARRKERERQESDADGNTEGPEPDRRGADVGEPGGERSGEAAEDEGPSAPQGGGRQGLGIDDLMSSIPQGDYLSIRVSANAFTVTSGVSSNQYTPGLQSEISAAQGDAQQISGWRGAEYVIETRPQWGPEIIQSYGLTKDGRLIMTLRLTGRGTDLTFARIYDRTTGVAPLTPPTIN